MGVTGKSASSSVPDDMVPRLRASGGKATAAPAKPREVLEPPPQPRKSKPKPAPKPATPASPSPEPEVAAAAPAAVATETKPSKQRRRPEPEPIVPTGPVLQVIHGATPQAIAEKTDRSPAEIVKIQFMAGDMVTETPSHRGGASERGGAELGYGVDRGALEDEVRVEDEELDVDEGALGARARRHDHGPRRPREDEAARRDPVHRRGRGGVR